jgi:AraC-like DNA-binding protein
MKRKYIIFSILQTVFCFFLLVSAPAWSQKPVSDSMVEQLMNQFRYQDASRLILERVKSLPKTDADLNLYYHNKLSAAQLRLRNIDTAMIVARESLRLARFSSDSILIVDAMKTAAYAYNNAGDLDSAMFFTIKILNFAERHQDDKMKRNALMSLATILAQNKRYREALDYHRKAYILTIKLNDSINFPMTQYNIGLSYLNLKQTDSCLYYLNLASQKAKSNNFNDLLIYIYGAFSDCYLLLKNETESRKYLLMANEIAEKIGNQQFQAMYLSNLTQASLDSKNYTEAVFYGQKAIAKLKISPYPVLQIKVDSMMYVANKNLGNTTEALSYLESFLKLNEEIVNEKQRGKLNDLVIKFGVAEKDLIIANQKLDIIKKQRSQQRLIIAFIFILLGLAGMVAYVIRSRQFRKELFRKEKYLDAQIEEMRDWMQWKQVKGLQKTVGSGLAETHQEIIIPESEKTLAYKALFAELREIFEQQKLYLDPEVNLASVIKILGTNKKYLYEAISKSGDDNFRNFINRYRVDEAKRIIGQKIRMKDESNLSEIYESAGFNSTVSFYRAFKSVTGLTPKEYATEIRIEMKRGTED